MTDWGRTVGQDCCYNCAGPLAQPPHEHWIKVQLWRGDAPVGTVVALCMHCYKGRAVLLGVDGQPCTCEPHGAD